MNNSSMLWSDGSTVTKKKNSIVHNFLYSYPIKMCWVAKSLFFIEVPNKKNFTHMTFSNKEVMYKNFFLKWNFFLDVDSVDYFLTLGWGKSGKVGGFHRPIGVFSLCEINNARKCTHTCTYLYRFLCAGAPVEQCAQFQNKLNKLNKIFFIKIFWSKNFIRWVFKGSDYEYTVDLSENLTR